MATATKPKPAATAPTTTAEAVSNTLRAYQQADPDTGEVTSRFRYMTGEPKQYRCDLKKGSFNINSKKEVGQSLSFVPLALRLFKDDILNMGQKEWVEIFFVDEAGHVSAILFHGYSVENLMRLNRELFWDDLQLTDARLTVTCTRKETTKDGKKAIYYIADFAFEAADPAEVQANAEFVTDHYLYRSETLTGKAETRLTTGYRLPPHFEQHAELPAGEEDDSHLVHEGDGDPYGANGNK